MKILVWRCAISWSLLLLTAGCESATNAEGPKGEQNQGPAPGEGIDYTFTSLDVSSLGDQSENWCSLPPFSPASFVTLDKTTFRDLLSDYAVSWLTPLHEGIGGLEEADLFNASFEMIWATFDTSCNWNTEDDLTFEDDNLLDEQTRADVRQDISTFIDDATEVSSGETLRLSIHDCTECDEPLGEKPFFVNAQLTSDGVLVMSIELTEGDTFTRQFFITPNAIAIEADLADYSNWTRGLNADTRSGDVVVPSATGTITAIARKNNAGGISATLGISSFTFNSEPNNPDNVNVQSSSPCMGMHLGVNAPSGEAQSAAHFGDVQVTVPGQLLCDSETCGAAEIENDWVWELGGLAVTAEQPGSDQIEDLKMSVSTTHSSRARVGDNVYAEGGLGPEGKGGDISIDVDGSPDGFLVTFKPKLNFGGAMTISNFSERLKVNLPAWLEDEIFDVTLSGDAKASVFVPARKPCADWDDPFAMDPPEPARREVAIREGSLSASVGSGVKSTEAGTCVGKTLLPEESLTLTSDWVDVGFVCGNWSLH